MPEHARADLPKLTPYIEDSNVLVLDLGTMRLDRKAPEPALDDLWVDAAKHDQDCGAVFDVSVADPHREQRAACS
jgi:hypothetical protein